MNDRRLARFYYHWNSFAKVDKMQKLAFAPQQIFLTEHVNEIYDYHGQIPQNVSSSDCSKKSVLYFGITETGKDVEDANILIQLSVDLRKYATNEQWNLVEKHREKLMSILTKSSFGKPQSFFVILPSEMLMEITKFLTVGSIVALALTCKIWWNLLGASVVEVMGKRECGDTLPYPEVSKEVLDRELDMIYRL